MVETTSLSLFANGPWLGGGAEKGISSSVTTHWLFSQDLGLFDLVLESWYFFQDIARSCEFWASNLLKRNIRNPVHSCKAALQATLGKHFSVLDKCCLTLARRCIMLAGPTKCSQKVVQR